MSSQHLASVSGGIPLNEILPNSQFIGSDSVSVRSCCSKWEECERNDIYVAIVGNEQDGHDFAQDAIKLGASAIVTERLLAIDQPQCIVKDSRQAFGQICHALAGTPSRAISTIGVSGTDGKTVTSHLLRSIYRAAGAKVGLLSSIEVNTGRAQSQPTSGPFNAPLLADRLGQMVLSDCKYAVVEMPSVALAQRSMSGVTLDAAVLTNIRQDHRDFHGNNQNYIRAHERLLEYLKPTGFAVLNADDPTTHFLLDQIDAPTLTIGMRQACEIKGRVIERTMTDQTFLIMAGNESVVVRSNTIGDQHIYNCLSAAAVALTTEIPLQVIAQGLESAGTIPGRLERIECGQDFGTWIDSAHSPSQLANAIKAVKNVTKGKVWCVCSVNDEQTATHRRRMGEIIERSADQSVVTRTAIEKHVDYEPFHQVLDGFDKPESAEIIPNRFSAIEWGLSRAKPGDSVLITGCGERPVATVGEKQWPVSDRDVCQAWLYDRGKKETESSPARIFNIEDFRR